MLNKKDAENWLLRLNKEDLIKLIIEHNELKQGLCARVLYTPIGCDDWINRAIRRARELDDSEISFRRVVHKLAGLILSEKVRKSDRCSNCSGTGRTQEETCCICRGTGLRI